ncbi:MAG: hypothetical protein KC912_15365 [Proteobacteria bacterium]|nr:hypothetical protein [Pseudomonadota bacterium]
MLLLLAGLALAGPPEGVDLEDTARWEKGVDAMLDGPSGCWEVVGRATWNHDFGRFYKTRGDAAFVGKLVDGVWTDFAVQPMGEVRKEREKVEKTVYDEDQMFFPLLGKVERREREQSDEDEGKRSRRSNRRRSRDEDESASSDDGDRLARNALTESLNSLSEDVEYSWAKWDEETGHVVLERVVPLKGGGSSEARLSARFPDGGSVPTRMTVTFPESFMTNNTPAARVQDAVVQLRGRAVDGEVFPSAEAFSLGIGVLGFRFHMAQTIRYTDVHTCLRPPPATAETPTASP